MTKQEEARERVLDLMEALAVGQTIPSERHLTQELGVSRLIYVELVSFQTRSDLSLELFKGNATAHWLARLEEQDLLCAPVRTLAEALADQQTAINGMVLEGPGEVERMRVLR